MSSLAKEENRSSSDGMMVSSCGAGGITLAELELEALQGLQVKAARPCLGRPEGPGG